MADENKNEEKVKVEENKKEETAKSEKPTSGLDSDSIRLKQIYVFSDILLMMQDHLKFYKKMISEHADEKESKKIFMEYLKKEKEIMTSINESLKRMNEITKMMGKSSPEVQMIEEMTKMFQKYFSIFEKKNIFEKTIKDILGDVVEKVAPDIKKSLGIFSSLFSDKENNIFSKLSEKLTKILNLTVMDVLKKVSKGLKIDVILNSITDFIGKHPKLVSMIKIFHGSFLFLRGVIKLGVEFTKRIIGTVVNFVKNIVSFAKNFISGFIGFIYNILKKIYSVLENLFKNIVTGKYLISIFKYFYFQSMYIKEIIKSLFKFIGETIFPLILKLINAIMPLLRAIFTEMGELFSNVFFYKLKVFLNKIWILEWFIGDKSLVYEGIKKHGILEKEEFKDEFQFFEDLPEFMKNVSPEDVLKLSSKDKDYIKDYLEYIKEYTEKQVSNYEAEPKWAKAFNPQHVSYMESTVKPVLEEIRNYLECLVNRQTVMESQR